ncbi:DUF2336 domain-containing protein [Sphingosinicella sp. YJ22]|uniref:DUF2336 domain-containing protein n=1 Tax=Sphingosinicella sp. YJ22 TaxID=1104780 RepID=UPI00140CB9F4|nr:DUF2336 domain-containing protein [Sphingosinicella sp. YJ22]
MAEAGSKRRERSDAARLLLAAARERFAVAATDLLLPEQARLSEWQRLTAANLLSRLIRSIEDALRVPLAEHFAGQETVHAALSSAHVPIVLPILERAGALGDSDLGTVLVRRVEEHRFWKAYGQGTGEDLLYALVRDADADLASEAMEMVIARSRRFDRFQEPVLGHVDLPAELQHKLVWLVAAALRHYLVQQHGLRAVDAAVEAAASAFVAQYDEGAGLEAAAVRLSRRLHTLGRLDGAILTRALSEGMLPLFIAGLGVRAGLDHAAAWEILSDPRGRGPALLLRAGTIERDDAAAILLLLNSRGRLFSGAEGDAAAEQLELYDSLDAASAAEVMRLWQADPAYRASVARLSTRASGSARTA